VENRRRSERQPAVWIGSGHVETESSDVWRDCGVFDVSAFGVGIDLRYPEASELMGRRISVRLPVGTSVNVTLTGEVRNVKPGPEGIVRAGIEFADLTGTERLLLGVLERGSVLRPSE